MWELWHDKQSANENLESVSSDLDSAPMLKLE